MKKLKQIRLIFGVLLSLVLIIGLLFYLDWLWQIRVINSIKEIINNKGETTENILLKKHGALSKYSWRVVHLDDELWLGAQVHCIISVPVTQSSVSNIIYAWQWDKSWPNPLALTRRTADLFPQLDPKCILTDSTRSRLYSGKLGLTKYFSEDNSRELRSNNSADGKWR